LFSKLRATFDGQDLTVAGTRCLYRVHRERYRRVASLEIGVEMEPRFCFAIRRENAFDRFAKFLHIAKEWQTGENEFDSSLYVISDDPTLLHALSGDGKLRSLVTQLLSDSSVHTLRCNEGMLWVERNGEGINSDTDNENAALTVAGPIVSGLCAIKDY